MIGSFYRSLEGFKFAIVTVDYFTKWAETNPCTTIIEVKCINFIWNNIFYRFGVPFSLVSDNTKQFENANTAEFL